MPSSLDWFIDADTDIALDIIEVSFQMIQVAQNDNDFRVWVRPQLQAKDAIAKLNQRFQEHAIGYRLQGWRIVRLDSEFLHTETTEPAFRLLYEHGYEGALEEFRLAHKQYRDGPATYDDCLDKPPQIVENSAQDNLHAKKLDV